MIGVVGRLLPEKGVDVFLRAAALVSTVTPTARFLVVGEGPRRADLEQLAASLGIAHRVTFAGFHPDAPRLVAGLDVLAIPSCSDGSPLVVCEAMAAGVPVVASRVGGLPDLVDDGSTGLLVRSGEREDLARVLVSLLLDPAAARRLVFIDRLLATLVHLRHGVTHDVLACWFGVSRSPITRAVEEDAPPVDPVDRQTPRSHGQTDLAASRPSGTPFTSLMLEGHRPRSGGLRRLDTLTTRHADRAPVEPDSGPDGHQPRTRGARRPPDDA